MKLIIKKGEIKIERGGEEEIITNLLDINFLEGDTELEIYIIDGNIQDVIPFIEKNADQLISLSIIGYHIVDDVVKQLFTHLVKQINDCFIGNKMFVLGLPYKEGKYTGFVLRSDSGITPDGQGKLRYPDGSVYEGYWHCNRPCGKGKYIFPDGFEYEGQWVDDKFHRQGVKKEEIWSLEQLEKIRIMMAGEYEGPTTPEQLFKEFEILLEELKKELKEEGIKIGSAISAWASLGSKIKLVAGGAKGGYGR